MCIFSSKRDSVFTRCMNTLHTCKGVLFWSGCVCLNISDLLTMKKRTLLINCELTWQSNKNETWIVNWEVSSLKLTMNINWAVSHTSLLVLRYNRGMFLAASRPWEALFTTWLTIWPSNPGTRCWRAPQDSRMASKTERLVKTLAQH